MTEGVSRFERHDGIGLLLIDSPPVNAINHAIRVAIIDAVETVAADPALRALVIACAGKTFCAGADIRELGNPAEPLLPTVVNTVEACPKPVVAAIHGTALGGGLEIALGCHYRIALTGASFGLPEVDLGFLPGAGGGQRLARLIGIEPTLDMVALAKRMKTAEALSRGLVDTVVEADLVNAALAFARDLPADATRPTRDLPLVPVAETLFDEFLARNRRKIGRLDAPQAAVDVLRQSMTLDVAAGLALERKLSLELREGPQSKALRHAFMAEREAGKLAPEVRALPRREVTEVGIVGSGTMGVGIALAFLGAGLPVRLLDTQPQALERGVARIHDTIARNCASGRISADAAEAQKALLTPVGNYAALEAADLVVEAAFETIDVKQDIFAQLDSVTKPEAILATNTSYLDIDAIASSVADPTRVLGMHFFSPANIMKLLEVVRGARTAPDVLATVVDIGRRLGKIPVVSGNAWGFIGNRMLAVRRREADALVHHGASPYEVDAVMEAFGMPMGPFRISDLAGLDLGWSAESSTGSSMRERLCEAGRRGQKTDGGFYDYSDGKAVPSDAALAILRDFARDKGFAQRSFDRDEIRDRLLYPMFSEAARILGEGIAERASDIDVVWFHGYGWPRWTGGPAYMADQIGAPAIVARLEALGMADSIAPELRRLAETNGTLADLATR